MGFWIFTLIFGTISPLLMILAGRFMWKGRPSQINSLVGYRTNRSIKNADTWEFAHTYCGKLWWRIGWIMLVPSVVAPFFVRKQSQEIMSILLVILISIQCVVILLSIIPTEQALKKTFDENGQRRQEQPR